MRIEMKKVLRIVLLIINVLSCILVFLFGATGILYEIAGPSGYNKMLSKLKVPWSFEHIWLFMFVCLIILCVTYFLRKKFFKS